jgi:hypothetical protein
MLQIERVEFGGWPNCWRVSNGTVELIAVSDIGPRIIRFGFVGGQNLFRVFENQAGASGEDRWTIRGGHRLWIGPEHRYASYGLDNEAVQASVHDNLLTLTQSAERETNIEKQMIIRMAESGTDVSITHRLKNHNLLPTNYAVWALSVMNLGGRGFTGFPPRGTHPEVLEPSNPLIMWAFTNLADPRWQFNQRHLILRQEPGNRNPQKLGHWNAHTWGAYHLNDELFVKQYYPAPGRTHGDWGCSFEIFTNEDFLELETLGPTETVPMHGVVEQTEYWSLHRNVAIRQWNDDELDAVMKPILRPATAR